HVLAVAGAPLLVNAAMAFAVPPVGDDDYVGKYASNAVFMAGVVALLVWAWRRTQPSETAMKPR
ncbi:MAG: hypothetical protein ACRDXX_18010, partial [Stackebrandtia sp.]